MTRLDATNEPSMEDILASIRKIIAEDPPGSRVAPTAPPAATRAAPVEPSAYTSTLAAASPKPAPQSSVFSHAPQRDALYDTQPLVAEPAQPAPYKDPAPRSAAPKPDAQKPDAKSFLPGASTFFPKDASASQPRVEPSFGRPAQSVAAPEQREADARATGDEIAPRNAPNEPSLLSVDAQLSDLLGDVIHAPLPMPRAEQHAPASPASLSTRASLSTAAPSEPASRVEHRDGFTVSRVAFGEPASAARPAAAEPDPFDFDLGPSPFESKTPEAKAPAGAPLVSEQPVSAAPIFNAPAFDAPVEAPFIDPVLIEPAAIELPVIATPEIEAPVAEPAHVAAPPARSRLEELVAAAPRVQPSLAATMAPAPVAPAPVMPPVAPAMAAAPDMTAPAHVVSEPEPVAAEQTLTQFLAASVAAAADAQAAETTAAPTPDAPAVSMGAPVQAEASALHVDSSAPPAPAANSVAVITDPVPVPADHAQRSMEDTVAELLRPMLRSWLAENMPRIVERALRREVAEQMQSTHKTAAE